MTKLTKFTVLSVVTLLALPGVAMAAGEVHPAPTEKGYTTHPDHKTSAPQSRDKVKADLAAAKKDGSADRIARGLPLPDKNAGPAKTCQEVKDELKYETAEQRRKRVGEMKGATDGSAEPLNAASGGLLAVAHSVIPSSVLPADDRA